MKHCLGDKWQIEISARTANKISTNLLLIGVLSVCFIFTRTSVYYYLGINTNCPIARIVYMCAIFILLILFILKYIRNDKEIDWAIIITVVLLIITIKFWL